MERNTVLHRMAWLVVLVSQIWLIARVEQLTVPPQPAADVTVLPASAAPRLSTDVRSSLNDTDGLPEMLQRIDTRLTQLERASTRTAPTLPVNENHEPSALERAEADQRLSTLLPSGRLSREDMARFHADIQALPPEQRFAMATALARAINEGRVQPGPEGL